MELKEWISILISLTASLVAMSFGFGGQREAIRRLKKDVDNIGDIQRAELSPFLQDIRERLIRLETESLNGRERADRLEKLLQSLLQKV